MSIWGLTTYKKDKHESQDEDPVNSRRPVACEVYGDVPMHDLPPSARFVLSSNANLRTLVREYETHLKSDTARFIHLLWESLTGEESVEAFLEKDNELRAYQERTVEYLAVLEHFGDFFHAGRALEDAFDIYSRLTYVRLNITQHDMCLINKGLVGSIIKCARSAESLEQKKLAVELLEHCLLYESITGRFSETMSQLLRRYYTSKDSSQEFVMPACIKGWSEEKSSRISGWTLSALQTMDMTVGHSLSNAADSLELCLQIQYSIYIHLWKVGCVDRTSLSPSFLASEIPSGQECQICAALSYILADVLFKNFLTGRIGTTSDLVFTMNNFPIWLVENEAHAKEQLKEIFRCVQAHESSFILKPLLNISLKSLLPHSKYHSDLCAQCTKSLRRQALEAVDTPLRLRKRGDPSLSNEDEKEATGVTVTEDTEAMDAEMTESCHNGAPQSSVNLEEPSAMTQSLYLCSSSIQSSMLSMLSMASRIRRNADASAIITSSRWSSNSMTMSISKSFGFGRITGMDSDALPVHSIDIMEVEEEPIFEQDLVLVDTAPESIRSNLHL
jgi:hypothetical protein